MGAPKLYMYSEFWANICYYIYSGKSIRALGARDRNRARGQDKRSLMALEIPISNCTRQLLGRVPNSTLAQ